MTAAHEREPLRQHDPQHPYVMRCIGCGHGRLFTEPCVDCEIVRLREQYKDAAKTIQRVRDRLRVLGAPMLGQTSLGQAIQDAQTSPPHAG